MSKQIIQLIPKKLIIAASFLACLTRVLALEIQSDFAEFNDKKGTAVYQGNAVLEEDGRRLNANRLVIYRDNLGKIESIIASGNPATFYFYPISKQSSAKTSHIHPSTLIGESKIIKYFPKKEIIIFLKNAILQQNSDKVYGEHLTYSLTKHTLIATPKKGKKTTLVLSPHSSQNTHTNAPKETKHL